MKLRRDKHETAVMGEEPMWNDVDKLTEPELSSRCLKAINWYNYFCDESSYREYVFEYAKLNENKTILAKLKQVDKKNYLFRDIGSICRILTNGGKLTNIEEKNFKNKYKQLILLAKTIKLTEQVEETVTTKPSVQDHIKNKAADTVGELEVKIDEFIEGNYKEFVKTFNIQDWIISRKLKTYECEAIHDHYSKSLEEKKKAFEGSDKQLVEGYQHYPKMKLKKYVEVLNKIVEVSGQFALQKKERKPRKKKKKSSEQLIKKLKYQTTQDTATGLTSADPRSIIGASKLLVYNTKYCKVCLYESESLEGLSIKGSTLLNVNKAVCKIVRKPKDFFKNMAGIRSVQNHYESLKTKESEASPRLNENTIIVKAFK
jgi:hypothetical protein